MKIYPKSQIAIAAQQKQVGMVNDFYRIYVYESDRETKTFNPISSGPIGSIMKIGFCAHLGMTHPTYTGAQVLSAIQTLNGTLWRDEVKWGYVEASKGSLAYPGANAYLQRAKDAIDAAESYGITPQLILNYGNTAYGFNVPAGYQGGLVLDSDEKTGYAGYCSYIVAQIGNKCRHWEVWNEWNLGLGTTTQEGTDQAYSNVSGYLEALQVAYKAAKAANPDAIIISGVIGEPYDTASKNEPWFNAFLATDWYKWCDEFSFHHYHKFAIPERWHDQIQDTINKVRAVAPNMPVRMSETGWFNGADAQNITEAEAAARYSRYPFLLRCLDLSGVTFYDLANDGATTTKEENFGFYTENLGAQKAQAATVSAALAHIKVATSATHYADVSLNRRVVVMDTNTANGQRAACWAVNATGSVNLTVTAASAGTLSVQTLGGSTATQGISAGAQTVNVTLTDTAKVVYANVPITIVAAS